MTQNEFISVVITVKNEEENIPQLLDSLLVQKGPFEIIIVDADSSDNTPSILKDYASKYDKIKYFSYDDTRGESRNYGVKQAKGDIIAFTDGNCIVNPNWLDEIRKKISKGYDFTAGETILEGHSSFSKSGRVELYHNNGDASFPTCNIAYRKKFFEEIGGFDPWFKEAEDVDLNYRALDKKGKMDHNKKMIVRRKGGETPTSFIKKSFWYGFGRKELEIRHGSLWSNYNMLDMLKIRNGESMWKLVRLSIAFLGYVFCIFVGNKPEKKEKLRKSKVHQH